MAPTTTSNVGVFDISMYKALNKRVSGYFQEDAQLNWLPQSIQTPLHAPLYKKPIYGASSGVKGAHSLGEPDNRMITPQSTIDYNLEYVYSDIYYDVNDMLMEGQYLVQRKAQELATFENQVKQSVMKGVFSEGFSSAGVGQGKRLNTGIIEQATLVTDLNGGDSALDAAGDVYAALSKMVESIPFRFRDGKTVVIGCDDRFAFRARGTKFRGSTNQMSELDLFLQELSTDTFAQNGQKVAPKLIVSNQMFLNTVAGTSKTETDTLGTHSRLFATVVDPEVLEQAYSFVGMVGEDKVNTIQSVVQRWASRVSGCVHQPTAVVYSEQITFA